MGGSLSKHNWRSDRSKSKSSASTLQIKTDSDKEEQKIQKEKKVKKMPKYVSSSSCSIKSCCPNGSQPKKLQDTPYSHLSHKKQETQVFTHNARQALEAQWVHYRVSDTILDKQRITASPLAIGSVQKTSESIREETQTAMSGHAQRWEAPK